MTDIDNHLREGIRKYLAQLASSHYRVTDEYPRYYRESSYYFGCYFSVIQKMEKLGLSYIGADGFLRNISGDVYILVNAAVFSTIDAGLRFKCPDVYITYRDGIVRFWDKGDPKIQDEVERANIVNALADLL